MIAQNEREERTRSIRKHLLDYMQHGGPKQKAVELARARAELDVLIALENLDLPLERGERAAPVVVTSRDRPQAGVAPDG